MKCVCWGEEGREKDSVITPPPIPRTLTPQRYAQGCFIELSQVYQKTINKPKIDQGENG